MKTVGCGIIGAGWWATFAHIPAVLSHEKARLVAVQCRKLDKAQKVARDFDAEFAFDSVEAILACDSVDCIIVSTTPNVHYVQAKAALEAGKHVLLEKPMTFTAVESAELCEIAECNGLQFLVSCPWHYTRHGEAAQSCIVNGELGHIKMISVLMTNPIDRLLKGIDTSPTHGMDSVYVEPNKGSYNDAKIAGGGQIYCQVSHVAAYLTFLTGLRPLEVFARFDNDGSMNDIYDTLNIKMEGGALASIATTAATDSRERSYEVRVYGTEGMLFLELWKGTFDQWSFAGEHVTLPPLDKDEVYPERAPALNLIDAILDPSCNRSPALLGHASMEVIHAACESAASGKNVSIRKS